MGRPIAEPSAAVGQEPVPTEILAVIAAAATVLLGANLRKSSLSILSVEQVRSTHDPMNRWSRQGRTSVQASHILRRKR